MQIQATQRVPKMLNLRRNIPRPIIIKLPKNKHKERIFFFFLDFILKVHKVTKLEQVLGFFLNFVLFFKYFYEGGKWDNCIRKES